MLSKRLSVCVSARLSACDHSAAPSACVLSVSLIL